MDRMKINAALWDLVNRRNIPAAAQEVVNIAHLLPTKGFIGFSFSRPKGEGNSFTGHTQHGNVTVQDDHGHEEPVVTQFGMNKERIGHFKVWREGGLIQFSHYWAADTTTEGSTGESVETFCIKYKARTRLATGFGVWGRTPFLAFNHFKLYINTIHCLWGKSVWRLEVGGNIAL